MGVYSTNRSNLGPIDVVAAEGYHGNIGVAQMMIEACQNDQAFFEAVIGNDFREAFGIAEGTILESELLVVNEAGFGGFIDKIKEMLTKLLAKIKGLFAALIAKIQNVFIRDNKAYVEKYKSIVINKNLSKMKYKFSKPTNKNIEPPNYDKIYYTSYDAMNSLTTTEAVQKYSNDTFDDNKAVEAALGSSIGASSVTSGEYEKEAHSHVWSDEEEIEGLSDSERDRIISNLVTAKSTIKKIEDNRVAVEKGITANIRAIDASKRAIAKYFTKDTSGSVNVGGTETSFGNATERSLLNAKLNLMYKAATTTQTVYTKVAASIMREAKFDLAQDRKVFAQAAAYNDKSVKESVELMDIIAEASNYEVDSCFDSYEF